MAEFTFGQVEAVLAEVHDIASDKRVAFGSRIKNLQKHGLRDADARPGRGKAGAYSFADILKLAVALELSQAGIPPQVVSEIVLTNWYAIRHPAVVATGDWGRERDYGEDYLLLVTPSMLRDLMTDVVARGDFLRDEVFAVSKLKDLDLVANTSVSETTFPFWRRLIINMTALTATLVVIIAEDARYATVASLHSHLQKEIDAEHALYSKIGTGVATRKRDELGPTVRGYYETDIQSDPPVPSFMVRQTVHEMIRSTPPLLLAAAHDIYEAIIERDEDGLDVTNVEAAELTDLGVIRSTTEGGGSPYNLTVYGVALGVALTQAMKAFLEREGGDVSPEA